MDRITDILEGREILTILGKEEPSPSEVWEEELINMANFWSGYAIHRMNDELREELHSKFSGSVNEVQFLIRYIEEHEKRFNEDFIAAYVD
jgi:hypothetical protein